MSEVDFTGFTQEEVLSELYNNSKSFGMGLLHFNSKPMTLEEARSELKKTDYFDYLNGRVMKVSFANFPKMSSWGYDRDIGQGAMQKCLNNLKTSKSC